MACYGGGILIRLVRAFDRPSRMALLPRMVPKEDIPNAVALGGTIWQLSRLIGPAVAGMMIYLFGIGSTYTLCFLRFLTSIALWPVSACAICRSSVIRRRFTPDGRRS